MYLNTNADTNTNTHTLARTHEFVCAVKRMFLLVAGPPASLSISLPRTLESRLTPHTQNTRLAPVPLYVCACVHVVYLFLHTSAT